MTDLLIYWLHMAKMYPLTEKHILIVNVMYTLLYIRVWGLHDALIINIIADCFRRINAVIRHREGCTPVLFVYY